MVCCEFFLLFIFHTQSWKTFWPRWELMPGSEDTRAQNTCINILDLNLEILRGNPGPIYLQCSGKEIFLSLKLNWIGALTFMTFFVLMHTFFYGLAEKYVCHVLQTKKNENYSLYFYLVICLFLWHLNYYLFDFFTFIFKTKIQCLPFFLYYKWVFLLYLQFKIYGNYFWFLVQICFHWIFQNLFIYFLKDITYLFFFNKKEEKITSIPNNFWITEKHSIIITQLVSFISIAKRLHQKNWIITPSFKKTTET